MANKTTAIYVRVEPALKEQAETVYKNLGISLSSAINIFLKQSVINNGFPFQVINKPVDFFSLSEDEQIEELEKSLDELKKGKGKKSKDAFKELDEKLVEANTLTREQLINEIMKGHEDIEKGDVIDAKKVFEELEKEFSR